MQQTTLKILRKKVMPQAMVPLLLDCITILSRGVVMAYLSKRMLDALILGDQDMLWVLALYLFACLLVGTLADALSKNVRTRLMGSATIAVEDALLHAHQSQEDRRHIPLETLLGYLSNTAHTASGQCLEYAWDLSKNILSIITATVYAWLLNPWLTILLLFIALLIIWAMRRNTDKLPKMHESFFGHLAALNAKLWEQIKNHEAASTLNLFRTRKGFEERNRQFVGDLKQIKKIENKVFFSQRYGPLLLMIVAVLLGGLFRTQSKMEISDIYAIVVMIPALAGALLTLPSLIAGSKKIVAAHKVLDEYFVASQAKAVGDAPLEEIRNIQLVNAAYAYDDENKPALTEATAFFSKGLTCVAGPSGGGKSTLLLLIMRIIHARGGKVLVNGRNIMEYSRKALYSRIGYAGQQAVVLSGTIRWNIVQAQPFDEQRFRKALCDAALARWINGLESKEETIISPDSISSGEKQKIAIARTLYRQADLLVLDEGTSAMDPASQQQVFQALARRASNKHCIVVYSTHSPALMKVADKVIWVDHGSTVAQGTFDEVCALRDLRTIGGDPLE